MRIRTIAKKGTTSSGFTLIEMIGVLAVIAILASLLIPKIFEAINNARINNAAISIQTVKTAVADHYAKYGSLGVDGRSTPPTAFANTNNFDSIMLGESFLDKPFAVKIGDGDDTLNNINLTTLAASTVALGNHVYDLDADGTVDTSVGSVVIDATIHGCSLEDARALDRVIDGVTLSYTGSATSDLRGRVIWGAGTVAGTYDINVYLTHR